MQLLFDAEPTFTWPIEVSVPDHGQWQKTLLNVTFRLLTTEAIQGFLEQNDGEQALLQHITVAIAAPDEAVIDDTQRKRLLGYSLVQRALLVGYQEALLGQEEKN